MTVIGDHEYFYKNNSAAYLKVLTDELVGSQEDDALVTKSEDDSAIKLASTTAILSLMTAATLILQ